MKIANNTHYYSILNKVYNIIPDSDSWQFQSSKRLSYSQRLFWEYKFVKSCGGQAFFYTFTYNDDNLPHFEYDRNVFDEQTKIYKKVHFKTACFNYDHVRLLTNGIISKVLRRKYGSQLRYFVACERGEGKGRCRAKGQNPHYHVIFFISPLPDKLRKPKDVSYKRISPISFCHLCKCVWQYKSSPNKYDHLVADYKSARFGHCQPGNDLGLITDFDALSYVSKYVCKDNLQMYDDINVKEYYKEYFTELGYTYHSLYSFYYWLRQDGQVIDRAHFLEYSKLDKYFEWRSITGRRDVPWYRYFALQYPLDELGFFKSFRDYYERFYLPSVIEQSYRNYYNMYGSKVRTSKSLGAYGLNFVQDPKTNPHFTIDKASEVINQPICLYYYRKLYMDVVKCPYTGNPLYVLNEDGVNLKCLYLRSNLDTLKRKVYECLDFISTNYSNTDFIQSLTNAGLDLSSYGYLHSLSYLPDLIERFAVFRFVYEYRHYSPIDWRPAIDYGFTYDNIVIDYRRFLQSNYYYTDFSELSLLCLLEINTDYRFVSFSTHPSFSSFLNDIKILEQFFDVYCDYVSEIKKKNFSQSVELRQVINAYKYNPLYLNGC